MWLLGLDWTISSSAQDTSHVPQGFPRSFGQTLASLHAVVYTPRSASAPAHSWSAVFCFFGGGGCGGAIVAAVSGKSFFRGSCSDTGDRDIGLILITSPFFGPSSISTLASLERTASTLPFLASYNSLFR